MFLKIHHFPSPHLSTDALGTEMQFEGHRSRSYRFGADGWNSNFRKGAQTPGSVQDSSDSTSQSIQLWQVFFWTTFQ